jgi:hypothetical protein
MLRPHDAWASWGDAISRVLDRVRSREQRLLGRREHAAGHDRERAGSDDDHGAGADTTDDRSRAGRAHTADDATGGALPTLARARSQ